MLYTHQIQSKFLNCGDSNVNESGVEEKDFGVLDQIVEIGFYSWKHSLTSGVATVVGGHPLERYGEK